MIVREFNGRVLMSGGTRCYLPVSIRLSYEPAVDPLAVVMTVMDGEERIPWMFALDLLQGGVESETPVGEGDVRIRTGNDGNAVVVCLRSHEGHADLGLPTRLVKSFLAAVGPATSECAVTLDARIDELIEEILNA